MKTLKEERFSRHHFKEDRKIPMKFWYHERLSIQMIKQWIFKFFNIKLIIF
jgi:hypothetical protein